VPTFRETNSIIPNPIQNDNFRKFLKENNVIWVKKKHMADKKNNIDNFDDVETIMLPATFDLNILTSRIDILITDFS
ncbi:CDP-glycerol glycerophosphotransferase family protein, partial [Escherichia coli]|uniref:CDP-glycerol glycerophosphotransferase family protein n=1 Tax=Escherichia coli TaxID=562 RepID=UPI003CEB9328